MKHFFGKLGFIHRRLWSQDGVYRAAILFGPAPLVGCLLAIALWECIQTFGWMTDQPPRWAVPLGPQTWSTGSDEPHTIQPARPLPPVATNGILIGYEAGWQAMIEPIQVSATMAVDVQPTPLIGFFLDGSSFEMAQIIAKGPQDSLYVGVGSGFLAVRTAGIYAISVRLERPAAPVANCLTRLSFGPRRIVSNLDFALASDASKVFDAARFDLQPGLYSISWVFGCWHDQKMVGPGRITVLVGHPDDQTLLPARADDIVRPERIKP
jgi:hypothetical protein